VGQVAWTTIRMIQDAQNPTLLSCPLLAVALLLDRVLSFDRVVMKIRPSHLAMSARPAGDTHLVSSRYRIRPVGVAIIGVKLECSMLIRREVGLLDHGCPQSSHLVLAS
jgi:hypothetical protein